jgi:hypothetical protein
MRRIMPALLRRVVLVLLISWLPLQAVAGEILHAREAPAAQEIDHLTHGGSAPSGEDSSSPDCAAVHGFCHLGLNPGIVSSALVAADDGAGMRHLPRPMTRLFGRGADSLDRPPLLRV